MTTQRASLVIFLAAALCGCATYKTPGGAVSIPAITDVGVAEALARQPAAVFPARVIVARVQAPGYQSYSNAGYGEGRYSVVTTRDIETEEDFARLGAFPGIAGVGPLGRLLLPANLETAQELRRAAAQLRGDIVLLYTFDTSFRTDKQQIGPLRVVSLGLFRNRNSYVTVTCAAAFIVIGVRPDPEVTAQCPNCNGESKFRLSQIKDLSRLSCPFAERLPTYASSESRRGLSHC